MINAQATFERTAVDEMSLQTCSQPPQLNKGNVQYGWQSAWLLWRCHRFVFQAAMVQWPLGNIS
jgi:hypothetical protein